MNVSEGLDLQLSLALVSQRGADRNAIDAAEFSLRVESLEFAAAGDVFAVLGQLDELLHDVAEFAEKPADVEAQIVGVFTRVFARAFGRAGIGVVS